MISEEKLSKMKGFTEEVYKDYNNVRFDKWNYEDGCLLIAAMNMYKATGDDRYKKYVIGYVDRYVTEDGKIQFYKYEDFKLDDVAPGRALIFAYEETGNEKYRKAMDLLLDQLKNQPRTNEGNFWHKKIYPNQVWLDGLFMAQPFYMAENTKFGKRDAYPDICKQFRMVEDRMFNPESGLYYHGYDASKSVFWADKNTGLSANYWLRAIAWFLMALVETMEEMDIQVYDYYRPLMEIYKRGVKGVLKYLDKESNLFYQVVDKKEIEGNYLETSGSAMIAASIMKACRHKTLLTEKYKGVAEAILEAIIDTKLVYNNGALELRDTCSVAGLGPDVGRRDGSISYYLSEPIAVNDKKGIAATILAYSQYLMMNRDDK